MSAVVDPLDVLAVLEERPYLEDELVALFDVPWNVLRFVLKGLSTAGQVKRVGTERKWALSSYQAPVQRPHLTTPARMHRAIEKAANADDQEFLDDLLAPDEVEADQDAEVIADIPVAPERGQRLGANGRRIYPAGTRREAFSSAAAARDTEMREKSSTWRSTTKPNSVV